MATNSKDFVLGIDLGASSIGWALVAENAVPGGENIIAGVRVFPAGTATEKNTEKSKCTDRRTARGMRRQHQRRSKRRQTLRMSLVRQGLWPADAETQRQLIAGRPGADGKVDPFEAFHLRARALDEKLTPWEIGRALIHLSQRRGFQSNRRLDNAKETGTVYAGIESVKQAMETTKSRTLGELFARHVGNSEMTVRTRRNNYTARALVRDEFEKIWTAQAAHHPKLLTEQYKQEVAHIIFYQRPFDQDSDEKIGYCSYLPTEKRARLGHRLAQQFRILQELANLSFNPNDGSGEEPLDALTRLALFNELNKCEQLTFDQIRKKLKLNPNGTFNLETRGQRKYIKGNASEKHLAKAFGPLWNQYSEEMRDTVCEAILELPDDELLKKTQEWKLSSEQTEAVMKVVLPSRPGNVSLAAIRRLLPHMTKGATLRQALDEEKLEMRHEKESAAHDILPLPTPEAMNGQGVTNPVVRKSLYQVRKLVNAIIAKYGKPKRVVIEMARDTRGSIDERNEKNTENARNRKRNEDYKQVMHETYGIANPNGSDVLKYRLWLECGEHCPYCGKPLTANQVFHSGEAQVEHIIPYSRSLDDSFGNKTLAHAACNLEKGAQTPWEAWGGNEQKFGEIRMRFQQFKSDFRGKKIYLLERKVFNETKVPERLLNDTRYICRQVRQYLQLLYSGTGPQLDQAVRVCTGVLTAELRHQWGLNNVLDDERDNRKNRADHRHHAIDAVVIALTDAKQVKQLSDWSASLGRARYSGERPVFEAPRPFRTISGDPEHTRANFREQVKDAVGKILVSHKPTRRARGALHEETNYGGTPVQGTYVMRKPVMNITVSEAQNIRDSHVRHLVLRRLEQHGINLNGTGQKLNNKVVFEQPIYMTVDGAPDGKAPAVQKVRITVPGNGLVGFKNSEGEIYRYVMPGSNHHMEVFEFTDAKGNLKREACTVTLFEVRRRIAAGEPVVSRTHPTRPDAKLYTWFCKNDMVEVRDKQGRPQLCRVQKMSGTPEPSSKFLVYFRHHTASTLEDETKVCCISNCQPVGLSLKKITVSVLGEKLQDNS